MPNSRHNPAPPPSRSRLPKQCRYTAAIRSHAFRIQLSHKTQRLAYTSIRQTTKRLQIFPNNPASGSLCFTKQFITLKQQGFCIDFPIPLSLVPSSYRKSSNYVDSIRCNSVRSRRVYEGNYKDEACIFTTYFTIVTAS